MLSNRLIFTAKKRLIQNRFFYIVLRYFYNGSNGDQAGSEASAGVTMRRSL